MGNDKDIKNEVYYSELQASIRSYDQKLWMIPGLFFGVVILVLSNIVANIDFDNNLVNVLSLKNAAVSLVGLIFLWILILLYTKAHVFHIIIQKKIKEFDDKFNSVKDSEEIERISLTSIHEEKLKKIIDKLEKIADEEDEKGEEGDKDKGARFNSFQKSILIIRVSGWIKRIMLLMFIINLTFSYYCIFYLLFG